MVEGVQGSAKRRPSWSTVRRSGAADGTAGCSLHDEPPSNPERNKINLLSDNQLNYFLYVTL